MTGKLADPGGGRESYTSESGLGWNVGDDIYNEVLLFADADTYHTYQAHYHRRRRVHILLYIFKSSSSSSSYIFYIRTRIPNNLHLSISELPVLAATSSSLPLSSDTYTHAHNVVNTKNNNRIPPFRAPLQHPLPRRRIQYVRPQLHNLHLRPLLRNPLNKSKNNSPKVRSWPRTNRCSTLECSLRFPSRKFPLA